MLVSYAAINANLLVELHHMMNVVATIQKTALDANSTAMALAQQTASDLSAYKSQNAAWRQQYAPGASAVTAQMQK
jgi:hypothetical protein